MPYKLTVTLSDGTEFSNVKEATLAQVYEARDAAEELYSNIWKMEIVEVDGEGRIVPGDVIYKMTNGANRPNKLAVNATSLHVEFDEPVVPGTYVIKLHPNAATGGFKAEIVK